MVREDVEKKAIQEIAPVQPGNFPIVGIGASAGGVHALTDFFDALPDGTGMAFIILLHMAPETKSTLPEILKPHTGMSVREAADKETVRPDTVYTVPSDRNIELKDRVIRLSEKPEPPYVAHSIDLFFRSMAEDLQDRAIGVILSGMGSDGTFGAKLINHRLGMVMAQEPISATYGSMPEAAIETGVTDYILQPKEMPEHLIQYVRDYYGRPAKEREEELKDKAAQLDEIIGIVRENTGHDLSIYKRATLYRRITRRMSVRHLKSVEDYVAFLRGSGEEIDILDKEFLLHVTAFFQDPGAFATLKKLLKESIKDLPGGTAVRSWTLGCGTGEDTYSSAIILQECIEELGKDLTFRVFATDLDKTALNIARTGIYPASIIAHDVSPERLKKYFELKGSFYQVRKDIREKILFTQIDFVRHPPFSHLDLVTSRTVLLSLTADAQEQIVPILYKTMNPQGLVLPGTEDLFDRFETLFRLRDDKWKIYERIGDGQIAKGASRPPEAR